MGYLVYRGVKDAGINAVHTHDERFKLGGRCTFGVAIGCKQHCSEFNEGGESFSSNVSHKSPYFWEGYFVFTGVDQKERMD